MKMHPMISSLRVEDLAGNYAPLAFDYPARLLTRRVYALSAEQITEARGIAPMRVPSFGGTGWSSRPPC